MEIEVTQEKFAKALSVVSRVATGAKATLSILSSVLIKVEKKQVSLTATNLDMAAVEYLPAIKSKEGVIAAPARLLTEFVTNLPRGQVVKMVAEGTKIKITAGKYSSVINGTMPDDYPELPGIDEKKAVHFKLSVDQFKAGVSQVMVAASGDTSRPSLTGVYFNTADGALYIAATDGYRLAERQLLEKVEAEVSAIVPVASLQEVMRSISDETEEIELLFDESQVRFRLGEIEITSNLINGTFPDYRQLIPKDNEVQLVLDRAELARVTKMAAIFSREASRAINCEASKEAQTFTISAISNEVGENRSEIDTKVNADGVVRLDSRFLTDALNALEEDQVKFCFSNGVSPIVLRNDKSDKYTHIIMPLNN